MRAGICGHGNKTELKRLPVSRGHQRNVAFALSALDLVQSVTDAGVANDAVEDILEDLLGLGPAREPDDRPAGALTGGAADLGALDDTENVAEAAGLMESNKTAPAFNRPSLAPSKSKASSHAAPKTPARLTVAPVLQTNSQVRSSRFALWGRRPQSGIRAAS